MLAAHPGRVLIVTMAVAAQLDGAGEQTRDPRTFEYYPASDPAARAYIDSHVPASIRNRRKKSLFNPLRWFTG